MFDLDLKLGSDLTLSDAAQYVSYNPGGIRDISPATLDWICKCISLFVDHVGDRPVSDISPAMIHSWHEANLDRVAASTANSYLRAVKVVFSRLFKRGVIIHNPAKYVSYAVEPDRKPRAISKDHYLALRRAAGVRDLAIIDILWASGCRLGGLLSMSLNSLEFWHDAGRPCLAVRVVEKYGRARFVYAAGDCAKSVSDWIADRPASSSNKLFITSAGKPLKKPSVYSLLRRVRKAANIPAGAVINPHAFRHAFAIRMLDRGVDLSTVAAWMGHKDPMTTAKIYAVRNEDQLRRLYFDLGD